MFKHDETSLTPIISKPTTFISCTGMYTLEYLVELMAKRIDEEEYIWMDIFCVDQFAWTGKGRSEEMKQCLIENPLWMIFKTKSSES